MLALIEETVTVEDPALDFTLPGYDIELKFVLKAILGSGSTLQAKPFREGFSKVFPNGDRQAFAVEELMKLFGNGDEDCTVETISTALEADHGFNPESRAIWNLLEIMAEYDAIYKDGFVKAECAEVPDALCVPGMNEEALEAESIPMLEARRMEKERREH
ncbi:hypothetical protein HHX47_DHR5001094 [Lentinula edodes]|nr:hypothetical protein HHX47_DHR5001094 [Lentinula edodes]